MDLIKHIVLLPVICLVIFACDKSSGGLGVNFNIEKKTLSNGLTLVMVEDHSVPVVSYQTWFRVGSVDESPGTTGSSHLFEHLMFKGTPRYGPKQFFNE
ncbi:MAG: insulinase family protein, partial [Bdellovibrionota bacterium]